MTPNSPPKTTLGGRAGSGVTSQGLVLCRTYGGARGASPPAGHLPGPLAGRVPAIWIFLYCWTPFHATLMAIPKGGCCHWDQISRWVSISPSSATCTFGAGPSQGCSPSPAGWPHAVPSTAPTASSPAALSCWPSCSPALARGHPRHLLPVGPCRILHQLHRGQAP